MGMAKNIVRMLIQLVMGYIFVTTCLVVTLLMLGCYLFVWPFSRRLYRKLVTNLAYIHWSQFTFLAQWWARCTLTVYMENPEQLQRIGHEHSIAIFNHKYDIDWLIGWVLAERFGLLGGTKIYGKSIIRYIPFGGWALAFTESIFLKRDWKTDRNTITKDLKLFKEYPENYWVTLVLLCEGTRFTEEKHKGSQKIAREKGLPVLKHHLLPRTKGFTLSVQALDGIVPSILDLTLGFRQDGARPTFLNVINGKASHAEIYIRSIPLEHVPKETDEECSQWLHQLYVEKDRIYDNFVQNDQFTIGSKVEVPRRLTDLIAFITCGLLAWVPTIYHLSNWLTQASVTSLLTIGVIILVVFLGIRLMVTMVETKKGSHYATDRGK